MKFSENFERDYAFYLKNIERFTFFGNGFPKHQAVCSDSGVTAKESFYSIDSRGKNLPTFEPELLNKLLQCKASVNFNIKMWAQGVSEGTLFKGEINGKIPILEWEVNQKTNEYELVEYENMADYYGFPEWVISAILAQADKIYKSTKESGKLPISFDILNVFKN